MIWRYGTSLMQMMIIKPIETSKSKILRTTKTHTITACWLECQKTSGCESIGTDSENDKMNDPVFNCHLFGKRGNRPESSKETSLNVTEISPFPVSYFKFVYSIVCSCFIIVSFPFGVFL